MAKQASWFAFAFWEVLFIQAELAWGHTQRTSVPVSSLHFFQTVASYDKTHCLCVGWFEEHMNGISRPPATRPSRSINTRIGSPENSDKIWNVRTSPFGICGDGTKNLALLKKHFTLIFAAEESASVKKAVAKKSHNLYYEARLLTSNYDNQQKPKKVYCYISPKVGAVVFAKKNKKKNLEEKATSEGRFHLCGGEGTKRYPSLNLIFHSKYLCKSHI